MMRIGFEGNGCAAAAAVKSRHAARQTKDGKRRASCMISIADGVFGSDAST
jgi:hypothetical protein